MATQNIVVAGNLGTEFSIGVDTPNAITVRLDGTIVKNPDGTLGVDISALNVVSADTGNVLTTGADGGAFFDQAALQAIETVFNGTATGGFMTIAPGGTNGHAPTYTFDFADPDFCEGVQDCVGQALLAGAGIEYDDVANSISSALGNLTFGDGLTATGLTSVAVLPDPTSPSPVTVSPAGVSVTPGISADANNIASLGTDNKVLVESTTVLDLLTVDVCDAFGVSLFSAAP